MRYLDGTFLFYLTIIFLASSEKKRIEGNDSTFYPPNHPINQLAEIENSLFGHHSTEREVDIKSKVEKKKRPHNKEINSYLEEGRLISYQLNVGGLYFTYTLFVMPKRLLSVGPEKSQKVQNSRCTEIRDCG